MWPIVAMRFLDKCFCSPVLDTNLLLQQEIYIPSQKLLQKGEKNAERFCFFHAFLLICTIKQDKSLLVFLSVCGHINMYL